MADEADALLSQLAATIATYVSQLATVDALIDTSADPNPAFQQARAALQSALGDALATQLALRKAAALSRLDDPGAAAHPVAKDPSPFASFRAADHCHVWLDAATIPPVGSSSSRRLSGNSIGWHAGVVQDVSTESITVSFLHPVTAWMMSCRHGRACRLAACPASHGLTLPVALAHRVRSASEPERRPGAIPLGALCLARYEYVHA